MIVDATMWKRKPFLRGAPVPCAISVTTEEFMRIQSGLLPQSMEDKWFVYYEAPYLYWHRSWTGEPYYRLQWTETDVGASVTEMLWAEDAADAEDDVAKRDFQGRLAEYLVNVLLLGNQRPLPKLPREQTMGFGIYMHVERRCGDGWEHVLDNRRPRNTTWEEYSKLPAYALSPRNDALFAVLAGVCNYDGIRPISMPRGMPDDATKDTRAAVIKTDADNHSYVALRELLEYDWQEPLTVKALVDVDGYREFKKSGEPQRCFRWVSGPGAIIVSHQDMEGWEGIPPADRVPYTEISWGSSIAARAEPGRLLDILKSFGSAEDVRIVFWFDSQPCPPIANLDSA